MASASGSSAPLAPPYPMRINKYLAQQGHATRKGADELIEKGRVFINGRLAALGDKVLESDTVDVRFRHANQKKSFVYFAYNKPRAVITHSAGEGEDDIKKMVPELSKKYNVFPLGRLDKDSHGLIILTNDGRITERLLGPERGNEKEYYVRTKLKLRDSFKENMEKGVDIEGYMTKPAKVTPHGENAFSITITEGKKHQIRRMVVAMHNDVKDLERTRILNIKLGKLPSGEYRPIQDEELAVFLKTLGL